MECEVCRNCGGQIDVDEEKYVLLGTYHDANDIESETFFHFDCWRKYVNDAINKKSINIDKDQINNIFKMAIPLIKPLLNSILKPKPAETKLKEEIKQIRGKYEREPQSAQEYIDLS